MTTLSVQLYSLGAAPAEDPSAVVAHLAELGYQAVEPVLGVGTPPEMAEWARSMGAGDIGTVDPVALKRAVDEHGLVVRSTHAQLPDGPAAEEILDVQSALGSELLVVPALFDVAAGGLEQFDDLDRIKAVAERFDRAAERARARGIRIGYHNHFWEFGTAIDGRSGLERFYELVDPAVFAEVDVYWAQAGGRDPVDLVRRLGDRALLLHVKDGDGQLGTPSLPLGEGVVDVDGVLAAATAAVAHVVELEGLEADAVWPVLDQCARYLTSAH
jgi:sugar phosphate isomerase/epimerase